MLKKWENDREPISDLEMFEGLEPDKDEQRFVERISLFESIEIDSGQVQMRDFCQHSEDSG